jgi:hypothetical protein
MSASSVDDATKHEVLEVAQVMGALARIRHPVSRYLIIQLLETLTLNMLLIEKTRWQDTPANDQTVSHIDDDKNL